jgi:hypothetical protein
MSPWRPILAFIAGLPLLTGCETNSSAGLGTAIMMQASGSWPFEIAGHSSDFREVYAGGGISTGRSSSGTFVIEPANIKCTITGSGVAESSNAWRNQLTCADGRAADFIIRRSEALAKIWRGEAAFSDGSRITWLESSFTGTLSTDLARFRQLAVAGQAGRPVAATPAPRPTVAAAGRFPSGPLPLSYPRGPARPDDVAVIIGNANYTGHGKDIPDVLPAYADAESFRRYAVDALGISENNIIFLKDATQIDLISVFGTEGNPKGQLHNWTKAGRSRIHVYYSGHGAPGGPGRSGALVPVDAKAALIDLHGYPLQTLYRNLKAIPAESVTVILESCFSGASEAGSVIASASPVFLKPVDVAIPPGITVIAAGAADQIASWEKDRSSGLFTKYFLMGMAGEADKRPHGNVDGKVALDEVDSYLKETMTYYARRYYGREQSAVISGSRTR